MTRRLVRLLAVMTLLCAGRAFACTVSATSVNFGTIDPLVNSATPSTGSVTVSCPESTSYSIALGPGNGSVDNRYMASGSNHLYYNIYSEASYTMIWGDGTGGSVTVSGTADSSGTEHTVYGRVPWQSDTVPGTYSDSIVVTVSY